MSMTCVVLQVWLSDGDEGRGRGSSDVDSVIRTACNGFAISVLLQFTAHLNLCARIPLDIVRYINGNLECIRLFQRRNRLMLWQRTVIEKLNILFARVLYWTAIVTPFLFIFGIHWTFPCRASLVAYWILDECRAYGITTSHSHNIISLALAQLKKGLIFLINLYFWAFGVRVTCFVVGGIQILCQMTMRDYLKGFWEKCKEADENEKGNHNGKRMRRTLQMYRLIQVMGNWNNDIQQKTMMICLMSTGIVIHSLSLFTLVRLPWNNLGGNVIPLAIYSLMLTDCSLAIIVCFGGMLNIHTDSEKVLRNLKWILSHGFEQISMKRNSMEVKWRRKFLTSCSPIKVKFGLTNFLERRTPLNCMDVSIGLTVQLLLIN
ncbi:unnamed protein product [Orchesella dallaii]|uniref:Gustatory receptor n=1 Tax=Orchesella dallaii TaxID=48710 RepID=A0ABP1RVV6_9HEXA